MPAALAVLLSGVAGACVGLWFAFKARARVEQARRARMLEIDRLRTAALCEAQVLRTQVEVAAREEALTVRAEADQALQARQVELAEQEAALAGRLVLINEEARLLDEFRQELDDREGPLADVERETQALESELSSLRRQQLAEIERAAKLSATQAKQAIVESEIDDAKLAAEQLVRNASEGESSSEVARAAKRLMGISAGRITDHFYSERVQSVIALPEKGGERITAEQLKLVEGVANGVTLSLLEESRAIRIEGLDGVGREIARRCVLRMLRKPGFVGDAFAKMAREITAEVDREIVEFGQRGLAMLKIGKAHPEIVRLVGRLNFRTSYSQNQWEHSVEAGYLGGMLAAELGLDVKLARRAALLHDIGKALTHELDGSHALIGSEYARRFGESEVIANAIGAHHTDEPFGSAYAHLVAAADAMSGGRPGARRQTDDTHMAKLAEIERIARSFRGIAEAFAVQGGREVRVYVEEERISDAASSKLATDIAQVISREMTFPGQIKVTVIREFIATEMAS